MWLWVAGVIVVQILVVVLAMTGSADGSQAPHDDDSALTPVGVTAIEQQERQSALTAAVHDYLADNPGLSASVAIGIPDLLLVHGRESAFETASIVKLEILVRWLLLRQDGTLPKSELELARSMITTSDNAATDELCAIIAPLTPPDAIPGDTGACAADGLWGTDSTTAEAQLRVLESAFGTDLLTSDSRSVVRELTGKVVADQRWGVSAVAGEGEAVWLKNGWDERDGGWVVHSVGVIDAANPIRIAVLTSGSPDYAAGVAHVEALAGLARTALGR